MSETQTGPFLITGASGQLGRLALEQLLEAGAGPIIATTRSPEKLADYATRGVDVRRADFTDPSSLPAAFEGAQRMLLISTDDVRPGERLRTHLAAVSAAVDAGVAHIVYTSLTNPTPESPISFAADHRDTEAELARSGISHTILRNNLYADIFLMMAPQAVATGTLFAAAEDGAVGYVTRADCARAAVAALLHESATATFDITGPAAVGHAEVARLLSAALGTEIAYAPVSVEAIEAGMVQAGLPEIVAKLMGSIDAAIAANVLNVVSTDVEELTGDKPMSLGSYFEANASALRGGA